MIETCEEPTMTFLARERAALEAFFPGLDRRLADLPLEAMERPGNPAIALFREAKGPGLLVPRAWGGAGATLLQAVRAQRALACRAPSLGVAATMHHFSTAALVDIARLRPSPGLEAMLLGQIAGQGLYLASAFAEGRTGAGLFSSALKVERCVDGLRVTGSKRPCTLSASMDLLTASLLVPPARPGEPAQFAVAVIPAKTPGIERRPFWTAPVLGGAESDEVTLTDVVVPEMHVAYLGDPASLDAVAIGGFLAFELLATATYLGVASALAERVLVAKRGEARDRALLGAELETIMAALEGVALDAGDVDGSDGEGLVARALFVRHAAQAAIERAANRAVDLLGGLAFIRDAEVGYLLGATKALAFHPPSRPIAEAALDRHLRGEALALA
jgi:alkylation response protein AidB-like acyl-CoA dehydrogenase